MNLTSPTLGLTFALLATPNLSAQELSPRLGLGLFFTQPSDAGGKIYSSGWKVDLTIHVRRESLVEGRVRLEFGEFGEGRAAYEDVYGGIKYRAQTRLVGYDWLIPLGGKRATGVDLILGIGGVHWQRHFHAYSLPGNPAPYSNSDYEDELAFAGTVGFRFRLARNFELELHQVLTSTPDSKRDVSDAEMSHTALGVCYRF